MYVVSAITTYDDMESASYTESSNFTVSFFVRKYCVFTCRRDTAQHEMFAFQTLPTSRLVTTEVISLQSYCLSNSFSNNAVSDCRNNSLQFLSTIVWGVHISAYKR